MTVARFFCALFTSSLCGLTAASAQQTLPSFTLPAIPPASHDLRLNVVVDTKSGQPVSNLAQQNFTVLDNKTPLPITYFKIKSAADEPVSVIVLVDAVNIPFQLVAWSRQGIEKFLKANEGQLPYPTSIAVLTDQGVQLDNSFSTDGNTLSDNLEHHAIGLRQITRDSEWSDPERLEICIKAFQQLLESASSLPGRKILIWVSPGWPIFSGPRIDLTYNQQQQIFNQIVDLSTRLRQIDLTVYNINPIGVTESLGRTDYYQSFLKGIAKPNQAQFGNLGLQVLAVQSGGLALEGNSDVAGMIQRCLVDAKSWYEIGFTPPPADKPNEYHHIEVKVEDRTLTVRTRDGYYSNPTFVPQR
ncbi:MAG: VWA domain-containing protein [Terracidiphilus sp.]|jgi:VWFA-related protein